MRKRRVNAAGYHTAKKGGVATSNYGGGVSNQGDDIGNVTIDEAGRPIHGGVGSGLVPGSLPNKGLGAQSVAG